MAPSLTLSYIQIRTWVVKEANFFRVHLLYFIIVPLISAGIFYAANGKYHIEFIDALFLCYSALTVTGLSTVNLSSITPFQQAILFILMVIGNVTVVAWVMVLIRRRYFVQHLNERHRKKLTIRNITARLSALIPGSTPQQQVPDIHVVPESRNGSGNNNHPSRIQAEYGIGAAIAEAGGTGLGLGIAFGIRTPHPPDPQEPNGIFSQLPPVQSRVSLSNDDHTRAGHDDDDGDNADRSYFPKNRDVQGILSDAHSFTSSPRSGAAPLPSPTSPVRPNAFLSPFPSNSYYDKYGNLRQRRPGVPVPRRRTLIAPKVPYSSTQVGQRPKDQGLGGFPGPIQLATKLIRHFAPKTYGKMGRTLTIMPTQTLDKTTGEKSWLPEGLTELVIGRNSDFNTDELTDEQLEELGGLEYRALNFLSFFVIGYFIGTQLIAFTLFAPWLSVTHGYDDVFASQFRNVNKAWFAAFQTVGAYTGGGMSLADEGMVPFQRAYLMIFSLIFAILAGNHGLPIFMRLIIWILTKIVKDDSVDDQVLHFLLDHPRRCFLYLFPSHVTWFLCVTLLVFTTIEWSSFIVLNLGLEVITSLPPGVCAVAGLFQSFAVRASGFAIVNLSALAPSFQFLCIVMMYIAVYPVALSIRSTNVYEEQSLGVFEVPPEDDDEEPTFGTIKDPRERFGKYFGWHLRRQVAFDIWWLVSAIFLICIIERTKIMDDVNAPWFNVFRIIFELVSAFGGIGLSLGIPTQNYSFVGAFGPLSKLVVIVIMVRGRHRGLPVAIDRAIMLPEDLVPSKANNNAAGQEPSQPTAPVGSNADLAEKGQGAPLAP